MEDGIYTMSFDEYRAVEAASNHGLGLIARSPAHYKAAQLAPRERTEAFIMGEAIHAAVLEPQTFSSRYIIIPEDAPRKPTKAQLGAKKPSADTLWAIDWWNNFMAQAENRQILTAETTLEITRIADAVHSHHVAMQMLQDGKAEQSFFWRDAESDCPCKARFDWNADVIVDLKTTVNAHPEAFARDAFKYRYHCQAAFYSDAKQIVEDLPQTPRFCFIVVEKEFPYAVAVYWLDDQSIDLGRRVYRKDLETYAWCREIDSWPGYDEIRTLRLPRYAFVKESA